MRIDGHSELILMSGNIFFSLLCLLQMGLRKPLSHYSTTLMSINCIPNLQSLNTKRVSNYLLREITLKYFLPLQQKTTSWFSLNFLSSFLNLIVRLSQYLNPTLYLIRQTLSQHLTISWNNSSFSIYRYNLHMSSAVDWKSKGL